MNKLLYILISLAFFVNGCNPPISYYEANKRAIENTDKAIEKARAEFFASQIKVYPNPFYYSLTVECNPNYNQIVTIGSFTGKIFKAGYARKGIITFDTSDLNLGVYVIRVNGKSIQVWKK